MPASIGAPVRPVSFTLTEEQISTLDVLCADLDLNRSEWLRRQINAHGLARGVQEGSGHNHLPITAHDRGKWWTRLGKDNPNPYNREPCPACWPDGPPKKEERWGRIFWVLPDGSEVEEKKNVRR